MMINHIFVVKIFKIVEKWILQVGLHSVNLMHVSVIRQSWTYDKKKKKIYHGLCHLLGMAKLLASKTETTYTTTKVKNKRKNKIKKNDGIVVQLSALSVPEYNFYLFGPILTQILRIISPFKFKSFITFVVEQIIFFCQ